MESGRSDAPATDTPETDAAAASPAEVTAPAPSPATDEPSATTDEPTGMVEEAALADEPALEEPAPEPTAAAAEAVAAVDTVAEGAQPAGAEPAAEEPAPEPTAAAVDTIVEEAQPAGAEPADQPVAATETAAPAAEPEAAAAEQPGVATETAAPAAEPETAAAEQPAGASAPLPGPPPAAAPVPTPGPPPVPAPVPAPPVSAAAAAAAAAHAERWGRISDDGTVYVRTADGEREIGSWQAGDAAAGLAFYVRRYEDLATEVELLERRLASGSGDPGATRTAAEHLRTQVTDAAAIGDLASLDARLDVLLAACEERAGERAAAREQARAAAIAAKEALITEAEQIAQAGTAWKASGDRLRTIVDEWKQIRGIDRRTDDGLWKRFAAARDAFGKRRGAHFAQLDAERDTARGVKDGLVARAEELSGSSDWRETASAMRDLMQQWKVAPRASRDVENELWARFRAAQDAFFDRRSATFASRDAEQVENQKKKEELIVAAEKLDVSDPKAAQSALRELQVRFDDVGHVPRDAMRRIDDRMRAAEQRVRDAVDAEWRAASVESNPFLAELRARLAEAEQKLERAQRAGDPARIAKAESEVASRKALLPD